MSERTDLGKTFFKGVEEAVSGHGFFADDSYDGPIVSDSATGLTVASFFVHVRKKVFSCHLFTVAFGFLFNCNFRFLCSKDPSTVRRLGYLLVRMVIGVRLTDDECKFLEHSCVNKCGKSGEISFNHCWEIERSNSLSCVFDELRRSPVSSTEAEA